MIVDPYSYSHLESFWRLVNGLLTAREVRSIKKCCFRSNALALTPSVFLASPGFGRSGYGAAVNRQRKRLETVLRQSALILTSIKVRVNRIGSCKTTANAPLTGILWPGMSATALRLSVDPCRNQYRLDSLNLGVFPLIPFELYSQAGTVKRFILQCIMSRDSGLVPKIDERPRIMSAVHRAYPAVEKFDICCAVGISRTVSD
jgi:hypothetical protein